MPMQLTTNTGRLVWGHPTRGRVKKHQDGPMKGQPVIKDGQQVIQYSYGTAYPKQYFDQHIRPVMEAEARTGYPNGFPPKFSWKITDGDGVDSEGKPFSAREGYAGCYILAISTETSAPPVYVFENGAYRQIGEKDIKTGDYIANALTFKLNVPTDRTLTPSLYVNPNGVVLVGAGEEIVSAAERDPNEMFGAGQFAMPAGAQPVQSAGFAMPAPQQGQPYPQNQPAPYPVAQTGQQVAPTPVQAGYVPQQASPATGYPSNAPAQPQPLPQPDYGFVHGVGQPQPVQQPGFTQPVQPAVQPAYQQPAPVQGAPMGPQYGAAPNAYPSNAPMPGMPQPR